jgi:hypothetical protein
VPVSAHIGIRPVTISAGTILRSGRFCRSRSRLILQCRRGRSSCADASDIGQVSANACCKLTFRHRDDLASSYPSTSLRSSCLPELEHRQRALKNRIVHRGAVDIVGGPTGSWLPWSVCAFNLAWRLNRPRRLAHRPSRITATGACVLFVDLRSEPWCPPRPKQCSLPSKPLWSYSSLGPC